MDSLQSIFELIKSDKYSTEDAWNPGDHPRGQPDNKGQFTSKQLADNIETILHGTKKQKKEFEGKYFSMASTPQEFKDVGLKGDIIQTKYGVISRHKSKDKDHYFSSDEWRTICKNLSDPKKCIITKSKNRKGYNIYTKIGDSVMVGVEVKSPARDTMRNNLQTVYRAEADIDEDLLYPDDVKKATPIQRSLLAGRNPGTYTADGRSIIIIDHTPEVVNSIHTLFYSILKGVEP